MRCIDEFVVCGVVLVVYLEYVFICYVSVYVGFMVIVCMMVCCL